MNTPSSCPHELRCHIFENCPELRRGISFRRDGKMNIKRMPDGSRDMIAKRNLLAFLHDHELGNLPRVEPYLQHGVKVAVITEDVHSLHPEVDAIVTNMPDLCIVLTSADCPIVILFDPESHVLGAVHSGWQGTAGNIIAPTVKAMHGLGARSVNIRAAVGPYIQQPCYQIGGDVAEQFRGYPTQLQSYPNNKYLLDLGGVIHDQALAAGIQPEHIEVSGECTACAKDAERNFKYFSWRRTGPPLEVMLVYACVMPRPA